MYTTVVRCGALILGMKTGCKDTAVALYAITITQCTSTRAFHSIIAAFKL